MGESDKDDEMDFLGDDGLLQSDSDSDVFDEDEFKITKPEANSTQTQLFDAFFPRLNGSERSPKLSDEEFVKLAERVMAAQRFHLPFFDNSAMILKDAMFRYIVAECLKEG